MENELNLSLLKPHQREAIKAIREKQEKEKETKKERDKFWKNQEKFGLYEGSRIKLKREGYNAVGIIVKIRKKKDKVFNFYNEVFDVNTTDGFFKDVTRYELSLHYPGRKYNKVDETLIPESIKKLSTQRLLAIYKANRNSTCDSYYHNYWLHHLDEIKSELATREHVQRKPERKAKGVIKHGNN